MAEVDKFIAFGKWLNLQIQYYQESLNGICANSDKPESLIRIKYGNLEAYRECMISFTELYNEPLEKWISGRLPDEEVEQKEKENAEDNESGSSDV